MSAYQRHGLVLVTVALLVTTAIALTWANRAPLGTEKVTQAPAIRTTSDLDTASQALDDSEDDNSDVSMLDAELSGF